MACSVQPACFQRGLLSLPLPEAELRLFQTAGADEEGDPNKQFRTAPAIKEPSSSPEEAAGGYYRPASLV